MVESAYISSGLPHLEIRYRQKVEKKKKKKKKKKTHRIIVTVKKQSPRLLLFVYMSEVNLIVQSEPKTRKITG